MTTLMEYPAKTTRPEGFDAWTDSSWHHDGAARLTLDTPSSEFPGSMLVLWIFPDDVTKRDDESIPTFLLEHCIKGEGEDGAKILARTDDLSEVKRAIALSQSAI